MNSVIHILLSYKKFTISITVLYCFNRFLFKDTLHRFGKYKIFRYCYWYVCISRWKNVIKLFVCAIGKIFRHHVVWYVFHIFMRFFFAKIIIWKLRRKMLSIFLYLLPNSWNWNHNLMFWEVFLLFVLTFFTWIYSMLNYHTITIRNKSKWRGLGM